MDSYKVFIYEIDIGLLEDLLLEEPFGFEILQKKENTWIISTDKILPIRPIEEKLISPNWSFNEINPIQEDIFVIIPSYAIPINIKTGMAFGTGLHESTQLMLGFLKDFISKYDSILDVGCGSGILPIASKKLSKSYVKGIDIDEIAIRESKENALRNNVDIYFEQASPEEILRRKDDPNKQVFLKDEARFYDYFIGIYDIVLANLEAHIFEKEMKYLIRLFRKYLIISGIYKNDLEFMNKMFKDYNLKILKQNEKNDWYGFVLCF